MINNSLKNKTSQITTGDAFADYLTNIQRRFFPLSIIKIVSF